LPSTSKRMKNLNTIKIASNPPKQVRPLLKGDKNLMENSDNLKINLIQATSSNTGSSKKSQNSIKRDYMSNYGEAPEETRNARSHYNK